MHRGAIFIIPAVLICSSPVIFAKKKPPATPAIPQMTAGQKALHALNRLTFGPRPGDVEMVGNRGLYDWIESQLHPDSIPENPVLEARLEPLDSLRMSQREMVQHYPTQQMVKLMLDGRMPFPEDKQTRYSVQKMIARFQRRENADKNTGAPDNPEFNATALPDSWQLDERDRQTLTKGKPPQQLAVLESLTPDRQLDVLDTMPNGARQRLFPIAPPDVRRRIQIFNGPVQIVNQDLMDAKILRAVYSNRQLEEVLTDFWFNHFNVNLDKGADRYMVTSYERDVIRPHVLGHFKDLLLATAKSPAMLFYLDNWQSAGPDPTKRRKQGLNENYGRELMELHTLGVDGGYTQHDVTEVARCFTGWSIREPQRGGAFEFNERLHDRGAKQVLGVTIPAGGGMEDGLKVLDILAHSPATAHFISKSLAIRFVSDDPPETLVRKMATVFTRTDGDLREVMRAMVEAPEFWDPANFRSKVKSPLEMEISAVRAVNANVDFAQALAGQLNPLGEPLYRKLEPTGYSNRSTDWMNSASLLARLNFSMALVQNKIGGVKVDSGRFTGDATEIEQSVLFTAVSAAAQAAITAGLEAQAQQNAAQTASMVAGLTLGSPDFQRR
ncbi:MAG TPA: DUF1800 domain-containing protein [Bryobacteraceae bacterium]|jgi:uncharacterized protein (DUF1800 family)|nr:DUF1800 domain-containing protein [Bryobacteraceae bacterium]